ncbi:MAG: hypothetical protein A2Y25_03625 [Candidatus Melainabacteria bacterium GWF2_37_15]|nr:MAG: hypothetical protein A2Y25_03625 [Candidatus Melainabacteria bacterium GWF2_37_15]
MQPHKTILAKVAVEKSDEALKAAYASLDISLTVSQNRAYYAIFYIVCALAYLDDFIPLIKSHHKLMGYFNKFYLHESKIFDISLLKIYKNLILNRESADYSFITKLVKEKVIIDIESAKEFIEAVKPYISQRLSEEEKNIND